MKKRKLAPGKSTHRKPKEHYEQAAFISRLEWMRPQLRRYVAAVPNGEKRAKATAAKIKRQGGLAGFPDVIVMLARGGYFALLIEFKRQGVTRADPEQDELHRLYRAQGYRVELCSGCDAAWSLFEEYIASHETQPGTNREDGAVAYARSDPFDV